MINIDAKLDLNWTGPDSAFLQGTSNMTPGRGMHFAGVKLTYFNADTNKEEEVLATLVKNTSGATIAQYDLAQYVSGSRQEVLESTTVKSQRLRIAGVVAAADGILDGYWGWVICKGTYKGLAGTGGCTANASIMSNADDGAVSDATLTNADEVAAVIGIALANILAAATGYIYWDIAP